MRHYLDKGNGFELINTNIGCYLNKIYAYGKSFVAIYNDRSNVRIQMFTAGFESYNNYATHYVVHIIIKRN